MVLFHAGQVVATDDRETVQFYVRLMVILCLSLFLRVFLLASQPASPDDYICGISAINYMENGQLGPTMWNHPGLRNILIYWSMKVFGTGVVGVKCWSVLFGTLSTALVGLVARRIMEKPGPALLAAFFWSVDSLAIDFSRQAINDVYLAFFPLLGIFCSFRYLDTKRILWLLGAGAAFGLGLASKWSVLFQLVATILLFGYEFWRSRNAGFREILPEAFLSFAGLLILPFLVYLLTFIPWFGRGYTLSEWLILQKSMYMETAHHSRYGKPITGDIRAAEWFVRPVTYEEAFYVAPLEGVSEKEPTLEENMVFLHVIANPLVWLLVIPSALYTIYRGVRNRSELLLYLAALFLFTYLPLAITYRPIWLNTALAVIPYALMTVAYMLWSIFWEKWMRRRFLIFYVGAVALISAALFPVEIGKGTRIPYIRDWLVKQYEKSQGSPTHSESKGHPFPIDDSRGEHRR